MISGIYSALSGLLSFGKKVESNADNIANVNTDGFKKTRVLLEEQQNQGVKPKVERVDEPGPVVMEQSSEGWVEVEQSNVDLGSELLDMQRNQRMYEANLKTLKVADELQKSILDIES